MTLSSHWTYPKKTNISNSLENVWEMISAQSRSENGQVSNEPPIQTIASKDSQVVSETGQGSSLNNDNVLRLSKIKSPNAGLLLNAIWRRTETTSTRHEAKMSWTSWAKILLGLLIAKNLKTTTIKSF